jgi:hypothetical protein
MAVLYAVRTDVCLKTCLKIRAEFAQRQAISNREGTVAYESSMPEANKHMTSSKSFRRPKNFQRIDNESISRRIIKKVSHIMTHMCAIQLENFTMVGNGIVEVLDALGMFVC